MLRVDTTWYSARIFYLSFLCYDTCMQTREEDELLDLVDDTGRVIGQEWRSIVHDKKMKNFRLVEVVVANPSGDIFLARRAPDKRIAAGKFETYAEHVHPGEESIDAAQRALQEEAGLTVPHENFTLLGHVNHHDGAWGHAAVFLVQSREEPRLTSDHSEGGWVSVVDIMRMLRQDPKQFRGNVRVLFWKFARELFP